MTKQDFIKRILISSLVTAVVIALITGFGITAFFGYSPLDEDNTYITSGTVTDVYCTVPHNDIIIELSGKEALSLAYFGFPDKLYSSIGYDLEQLADLLQGKNIDCLRMKELPWVVEIYAGDVVIDNRELTNKQLAHQRVQLVVWLVIVLGLSVGADISYLADKYECYKRAEKKRAKKLKREVRKANRVK